MANDNQHELDDERRFLALETDIKDLTKKVEALETSISDLVIAWRTAGGVVTFVKWLAGIATSVIALIALLRMVK